MLKMNNEMSVSKAENQFIPVNLKIIVIIWKGSKDMYKFLKHIYMIPTTKAKMARNL